ncbi:MAG: tandem-95 repeat protein, partial [Planctomycetaceae bacterium]
MFDFNVLADGIVIGSGTATVAVTNAAPTADGEIAGTVFNVGTVSHDKALRGTLPAASDADEMDDVVYALTAAMPTSEGTISVGRDGAFQFVPATGWTGTTSFNFSVSDGVQTVGYGATITVTNATPQAATINYETLRNQPLLVVLNGDARSLWDGVYSNVTLLNGATDGDGDVLEIISVSEPAHGHLVEIAAGDGLATWQGAFAYVPDNDFVSQDTFTCTITDSLGASVTRTVNINVVNHAPTAGPAAAMPRTFFVQHRSFLSVNNESGLLNGAGQGGADKDTLTVVLPGLENGSGTVYKLSNNTYSLTSGENAVEVGTIKLRPTTGAFSFEPNDDFTGEIRLNYGVSDGLATTMDGTLAIVVQNSAPATTPVDIYVLSGTQPAVNVNVLDFASDPEFDAMSIRVTQTAAGVSLSATGGITISENLTSNRVLKYVITDGFSDSQEYTLNIYVRSAHHVLQQPEDVVSLDGANLVTQEMGKVTRDAAVAKAKYALDKAESLARLAEMKSADALRKAYEQSVVDATNPDLTDDEEALLKSLLEADEARSDLQASVQKTALADLAVIEQAQWLAIQQAADEFDTSLAAESQARDLRDAQITFAYETAMQEHEDNYNSGMAVHQSLLETTLLTYDIAFVSSESARLLDYRQDVRSLEDAYSEELYSAGAIRDAGYRSATAAFKSGIATAKATYQTALDTANTSLNSTVAAAVAARQTTVQAAQQAYDTDVAAAIALYNQGPLDRQAAELALADNTAYMQAVADAKADYDAVAAAAESSCRQIISQARSDFADAQDAAQTQYASDAAAANAAYDDLVEAADDA